MRTIKFRAWDIKRKVMVDEYLTWNLVLYNGNSDGGFHLETEDDMVDGDFELMQFTGLKDKNGKGIYESDLIKVKTTIVDDKDFGNGLFKVVWAHGGFRLERVDKKLLFNKEIAFYSTQADLEVIGNIYGNPELLK